MKHTVVLTRGDVTESVVREDTDHCLAAAWLIGYMRGALIRGWTIVSIESVNL